MELVLIVAKCIVNSEIYAGKVESVAVLIVAKCIVNSKFAISCKSENIVLIVAKCIVNLHDNVSTSLFSTY